MIVYNQNPQILWKLHEVLENLWVQVVQILKVFSKYFGNVVKQFCQFYLKGGKEKLKELLLYVVKLEPWVLSV